MRKRNFFSAVFVAAMSVAMFTACDSDNNAPGGDGNGDDNGDATSGQYVVAASSKEAVYLLQSDDLDKTDLTIVNAGIEAESATAWVFHSGEYAYRLVYNQGNAGTGSSYILNEEGKLTERSVRFEITNRFTTYGTFDKYVITAASGATDSFDEADINKEYPKYGVTFTYLDVEEQKLTTRTIVTENLVDNNGEYYTVSGIVDYKGKIYTALCPQGYSTYGVWKGHEEADKSLVLENGTISPTVHPDNVWVAIYDGVDFANPKILKDDRISYATSRMRSQFYQTIVADGKGDIYVFSASNARTESGTQKTEKPSGVIRIKAGTEAFDPDYYCNIEEAAGGYPLFKAWNIKDDYFLLQMYAEKDYTSTATADTRRLAIFKAGDKSFKWVDSGLPAKEAISSFGSFPFFENGLAYMPVVTTDGNQPAVYIVDPVTATAEKGITVTASGISAIGKLK